jgi:hypothetical protein
MPWSPGWAVTLFLLTSVDVLFGQNIPAGYIIPPSTISPDNICGVTVPKLEDVDSIKDPQNQVIEVQTGRLVGTINS